MKHETQSDKLGVSQLPPTKKVVMVGSFILLFFVFGGLLWSSLASLESAAVAPGKMMVESQRKTIQHLEGGIIDKIHIQEGSNVKAGDVLIELDATQAQTAYDLYSHQVNQLLSDKARLVAERDGKSVVVYPERLLAKQDDLKLQEVMASQDKLFLANKEMFNGQLNILQQRIEQLKKEIESLNAQVKAEESQLALINEEITAVKYLEEKKYIEKPRLLALQREAARLSGNLGEHLGLIARAEQRIGETEVRIYALNDDRRKKILEELRETQKNLSVALEREKSASDILHRTKITAPVDGVVVGLKKHTVGGVVSPGQEVLHVIPDKENLLVEARVSPLDIDIVREGLPAKVSLTAYKQRQTPIFDGVVKHISADSFQDEQTGKFYYTAYIEIDPEKLNNFKDVSLYPGMPAQVMIIVDKKTLLGYLISPITDSLNRAFREY